MRRRAYMIGLVALVMAANAAQTSPAYTRIVDSARNFQRYYRDLKGDNSLNPVERVVFSLVLSNSKAPEQTAGRT